MGKLKKNLVQSIIFSVRVFRLTEKSVTQRFERQRYQSRKLNKILLPPTHGWNERTRAPEKEQEEEVSENEFFEAENDDEFEEIMGDLRFNGVDLHLLESVFHQEPNPDIEWMNKMAEFVEASVKEVENWFIAKRGVSKSKKQILNLML